jgi:hypothetical protein
MPRTRKALDEAYGPRSSGPPSREAGTNRNEEEGGGCLRHFTSSSSDQYRYRRSLTTPTRWRGCGVAAGSDVVPSEGGLRALDGDRDLDGGGLPQRPADRRPLPRRRVGARGVPSRIDKPRVPGSAARGAEKRLRRMGFRVVAPAESFYVTQHERTACPRRGRVRRELGRAVGPAFRADQRGEAFRDGLSLGP